MKELIHSRENILLIDQPVGIWLQELLLVAVRNREQRMAALEMRDRAYAPGAVPWLVVEDGDTQTAD